MRNYFPLRSFIIFLFLLVSSAAIAQQDYLVTIKGDTLWGKVKYYTSSSVSYTNNSAKYVQITPDEGKKSTHEILKTLSFRINNEVYHTVKFGQTYSFMKLLKAGYLSLYAYQMENQITWDGRYLVKKDATYLDIPNLGFKKRISRYLADCPAVAKKVDSGDLSKSDLLQIVEEYNACLDQNTHVALTTKAPVDDSWSKLETEVKGLPEFDKKSDAVDIIREIQAKLSKKETVPSFLVNTLKDALKDQASIKDALDRALETLN